MQAKLVKASIWAKTQFAANSIPHRKTLKSWIERGKIRGLVDDDGSLWVYENEIFGVPPSIMKDVAILVKASA